MTQDSSSAAIAHLKKDPVMRDIIEKCKLSERPKKNDLFEDLVDAVISQQLSGKAAATIFKRFKELFGRKFPTPTQIIKMSDEKMRACGISYSKIKYIKGVAQAVENKELDLKKLPDLADEKVMEELVKLKGIGKWTAEMILIFLSGGLTCFRLGIWVYEIPFRNFTKLIVTIWKKLKRFH